MDLQRTLTPLQTLILEHLALTGENFNDLARRGGMPRQTLQALVNRDGSAVPRRPTLEKLATALQLPLHTVQQAAAASVTNGSHPVLTDDPLTILLLRTVGDLSDENRQVLLATARAMKKTSTGEPVTRQRT